MGRKKKEIKLKEPVRIREKNLLDGSISLYLDIYYRGNRKKEGLKLYLVPEINATTKLQNANTRKLAEQIKAQRILDIQKEGLVDWEKVKKSRPTISAHGSGNMWKTMQNSPNHPNVPKETYRHEWNNTYPT